MSDNCILCGTPCKVAPLSNHHRLIPTYLCRYCGHFGVDHTIELIISGDFGDFDDKRRKMAAALAAELRLQGRDHFVLVSQDAPPEVVGFRTIRLEEFMDQYPTSAEILDRSLLNLSRLVEHPAGEISIKEKQEYAYLFSESFGQVMYMVKELVALEYLGSVTDELVVGMNKSIQLLQIRARGWQRIDELKKKPAGNLNQAFVAMWFHEDMQEIFDNGIRPAVKHDDATECIRIDYVEHNDKICDKIIAEIRRSKYVVADFTGNRGGVYYEAGFALGLGLPVIYIGKHDWFFDEEGKPREDRDLHFDTRQYNHIFYKTPKDLKAKLTARIRATIT